jgi:hypothetical protein
MVQSSERGHTVGTAPGTCEKSGGILCLKVQHMTYYITTKELSPAFGDNVEVHRGTTRITLGQEVYRV